MPSNNINPEVPQLSIIIPYGTSPERSYIADRVKNKVEQFKGYPGIEVIFVEGYSSLSYSEIPDLIESSGHKYYKDREQAKFNQGLCRNIGVANARSQVCMFLDVDYHISLENLNRLLTLIKIKNISAYPNRFLALPCAFLSEYGSQIILKKPALEWDTLIQEDVISGQYNLCRFYSPASSALVVNRHKFLELGGNDPAFVGHGYEDFDLFMRFFRFCSSIDVPPPDLEYDQRSWNFTEYRGFRALMSVVGNESALYGLCLYHFHHPEPNNDGYLDNRELNHQLFYTRLKKIKNLYDGPDPLILASKKGQTYLLFSPENGSCFRSLRGVMPYLGKIICKPESDFFQDRIFIPGALDAYMRKNHISGLLFPNPYGNAQRLEIYRYARATDIPYLCYDRGAFPESWFFDANGFNYDSSSYAESNWDKILTEEQILETEKYIAEVKTSGKTLEKQNTKINPDELKRTLGIRNKKIVFIPFQVASDTVIQYYTDAPFDYYGFAEIVDGIALELAKSDFVFLAKKHPLMTDFDKNRYPNLYFVPDDTNINTLLELCDIVVTINSGVGLLAMLFEKPCITTGNAFYSFAGLNYRAKSREELKALIESESLSLDHNRMLKFVFYLRYHLYSYGAPTYTEKHEDGRIRRLVNHIDFYNIRINEMVYLDGRSSDKSRYYKQGQYFRPYLSQLSPIKKAAPLAEPKKVPPKSAKEHHIGQKAKRLLIITSDNSLGNPANYHFFPLLSLARQLSDDFHVEILYLGTMGETQLAPLRKQCGISEISTISQLVSASKNIKVKESEFPKINALPEQEKHAQVLIALLKSEKRFDCIIYDTLKHAWLKGHVPYPHLALLTASPLMSLKQYYSNSSTPTLALSEEAAIINRFNAAIFNGSTQRDIARNAGAQIIGFSCPPIARPASPTPLPPGFIFGMKYDGRQRSLAGILWFLENVWILQPCPSAELHIYGNINHNLTSLPDNIIMHTESTRPENFYSQIHALINASFDRETAPFLTLETLSYGRPVIASPAAAEGISSPENRGILLAGSRRDFLAALLKISQEAEFNMLLKRSMRSAQCYDNLQENHSEIVAFLRSAC